MHLNRVYFNLVKLMFHLSLKYRLNFERYFLDNENLNYEFENLINFFKNFL